MPSLDGQGLATAKLALRNHDCRLGRVRSHNPRHFKRSLLEVSRQGLKAGTVHRGRTKVSISLE